MKSHGGRRKGAGKPALYKTAMKRKNVMLDPETIAFYTKVGKGNLSEGIRQHWRSLTPRALDWAYFPCQECETETINNMAGNCALCNTPRQ